MRDRIIFLGGPVTDESANLIVAQLLFLSNEDSEADIHFYINSPGGSISAGMAIYDTMQFVRCDVATYCIGMAASMGAILLAAGHAEKRYVLPNGRVMLHQPLISGVMEGPATDLEIEAKEMLRIKGRLHQILKKHTGKDTATIEKDLDRNLWMNAEESVSYGVVDRILQKAPEIVKNDEQEND